MKETVTPTYSRTLACGHPPATTAQWRTCLLTVCIFHFLERQAFPSCEGRPVSHALIYAPHVRPLT